MPYEIPTSLMGYSEPEEFVIKNDPEKLKKGYQQLVRDWPRNKNILTIGTTLSATGQTQELDTALASLSTEAREQLMIVFNQDELGPYYNYMFPTYADIESVKSQDDPMPIPVKGIGEEIKFTVDNAKLQAYARYGQFYQGEKPENSFVPKLVGATIESVTVFEHVAEKDAFKPQRKFFTNSPTVVADVLDGFCTRQTRKLTEESQSLRKTLERPLPQAEAKPGGLAGATNFFKKIRTPVPIHPAEVRILEINTSLGGYKRLLNSKAVSESAKVKIVEAITKHPNYLEEHHFKIREQLQPALRLLKEARDTHVFDFKGYKPEQQKMINDALRHEAYFSDENIVDMYLNEKTPQHKTEFDSKLKNFEQWLKNNVIPIQKSTEVTEFSKKYKEDDAPASKVAAAPK